MAVGDKLVTLDGLKAVYQDVSGNIVDLKSTLNLKPTRNLLDAYNPSATTGVSVSRTGNSAVITATSNGTYKFAAYLIDTRNIDKLTVTYSTTAGTGSAGIRYGYNNSGDASSPTWIGYVTNNPQTINCASYDYIIIGLYAVVATNSGIGKYMTYTAIQVESGAVATDYIPHEVPCDTVARDNIVEINGNITEINNNITTIDNYVKFPNVLSTAPSDFGWADNPIAGKITNDFKGHAIVNYDISQNDPTQNGTTYYVDGTNGDDGNSGLNPDAPLSKMATALAKNDVTCIMLKGGIYGSTNNLYNTAISKTVAIKAMPSEEVIIAQISGTTFTADTQHEGTYYGTRGNCYGVVDKKYKNSEDDPVEYTNAADVATVYTTPASWILDNGTLYVHTVDGRSPDDDLLLFRSGDNLVAQGNITLYLEGLKVYGGNAPLKATATSGTDELKVYAKDCDFYYSNNTNGDCVQMQGTTISIFQNCRAKYSKKDGFNYHAAQGIAPKAIEIECEGAYCGTVDDADDQGSTIHDGGKIIRVNCIYHHNQGSNVADQADEGMLTEAWMVGCVAFNSLSMNPGQNTNYFAYTRVKQWLESCIGFSSTNNLYINDGGTIYLRNCQFEGKLIPSGQEVVYY